MNKFTWMILWFGLISATGCRKDYTCECKENGQIYLYQIRDQKLKDAEASCNATGSVIVKNGGSCKIKS